MSDVAEVQDNIAPEQEIAEAVEDNVNLAIVEDESEVVTDPEATSNDTTAEPQKKNGVQKRIDELVKEREDWKGQAKFFAEQARAKESQQQPQEQAKPADDVKPSSDDFETYEDYIEALTDYKTNVAIEARIAKGRENQQQRQQQQQVESQQQSIQGKIAEGRGKYSDFDSVAMSQDIPVSQAMANSIGESDVGGDLAYYFGSNRDVALKISQMSEGQAYRAIGQIEAGLSANPITTTQKSNAPAPISPVSKKSSANSDPDKMSIDDWMKQRNKQTGR